MGCYKLTYNRIPELKIVYAKKACTELSRSELSIKNSSEKACKHYPFGMQFGQAPEYEAEQNKYLYNGKQLQEYAGLNLHDYGWRQYDAALGRWHVQDQLAEKYHSFSPYNYVINNPLNFIDPDGREVLSYEEWSSIMRDLGMIPTFREYCISMFSLNGGSGGSGSSTVRVSYSYNMYEDHYIKTESTGEVFTRTKYLYTVTNSFYVSVPNLDSDNDRQAGGENLIDYEGLVKSGPDYIGGFAPVYGGVGNLAQAARILAITGLTATAVKGLNDYQTSSNEPYWNPKNNFQRLVALFSGIAVIGVNTIGKDVIMNYIQNSIDDSWKLDHSQEPLPDIILYDFEYWNTLTTEQKNGWFDNNLPGL